MAVAASESVLLVALPLVLLANCAPVTLKSTARHHACVEVAKLLLFPQIETARSPVASDEQVVSLDGCLCRIACRVVHLLF